MDNFVCASDRIELRKCEDSKIRYNIFLKETKIQIGYMQYRGYHNDDEVGDIGYFIYPNYRNKGYASETLSLFSEKLHDEGIDDFWIATRLSNVASCRVIEKYGATPIRGHSIEGKERDWCIMYEGKTRKREKEKNRI